MGVISAGDEQPHYSDGSHRWTAPVDISQDVWEQGMRAHVARHRAGEDGQAPTSPRDGTPPPTSGTVPPPTN